MVLKRFIKGWLSCCKVLKDKTLCFKVLLFLARFKYFFEDGCHQLHQKHQDREENWEI